MGYKEVARARLMKTPKKMLVAVDGSDSSLRACEFALALAKSIKSKVAFIHVVDIPPYPTFRDDVSDYVQLEEELEDRGKEILTSCESRAKSMHIQSESFLETGDPSHEIVRVAVSKKFDCVVLGKRGLGKLDRILMGSISDQVTKLSSIPTIIVK